MRIANNISALTAFNLLNSNNSALQKTIRALSSGLRINSVADDASGLAISEKMRSQIGGLDRAIHNTQDGISLLQTAEGALSETTSMLQRMRELAVQAANDTLTQQDRGYIQVEIDQLKDEINRTARTTQFNKKKILNGEAGALWSSSDSGVRALIHGAIGGTDQFGQYVSAEGNYDLEIRVEEQGRGQVQKTNLMAVTGLGTGFDERLVSQYEYVQVTGEVTKPVVTTVTEMVTETIQVMEPYEITDDIEGPYYISLDGGAGGSAVGVVEGDGGAADAINIGWNYNSGTKALTITEDGVYRIVGSGSQQATRNHIIVASGVNAQIFLENVNINADCAFEVEKGASAEVFLAGTNTLVSSGPGRAGMEVTDGAAITINSATADTSTEGSLDVTSGDCAAGIGGRGYHVSPQMGRAGTITINGGTITATSRGSSQWANCGGAGIGGGDTYGPDGGGTITINGGDITAYGRGGAGIGASTADTGVMYFSDKLSDGTSITITGGKVKAYGLSSGAGIGGGTNSSSGTIKIQRGLIDSGDVIAQGDTAKGAQNIGHGTSYMNWGVQEDYMIDLNADLEYAGQEIPDLPTIHLEAGTTINQMVEREVEHEVTREEITYETTTETYEELRLVDRSVRDVPVEVITTNTLDKIPQFYDNSGVSLIEPGSTITITQGDGKTADVTLYKNDTLYDVARKINDAIANTLGQRSYVDDAGKFCTVADGTDNTSEGAFSLKEPVYAEDKYLKDYGGNYVLDDDGNRIELSLEDRFLGYATYSTMVIRSVIPGKAGELVFSGNEELLNAFGLNTITSSSETTYRTTVKDAHTGETLVQGFKSTGSTIHGLIHPNVDVAFDGMRATAAVWDEDDKKYRLVSTTYSATLHLADNSMKLQTGANEGERYILDLGDMSADALGVSKVSVSTHETAGRAITIIDNALDIVNTQRAKMGAAMNTLEHTMSRLTIASENLTQAESRIRDADIAKMMLRFTKYQIMSQAGTSMLSQANQFPQQVLSLMR